VRRSDDIVIRMIMEPFDGDFVSGVHGNPFGHRRISIHIAIDVGISDILHRIVVLGRANVFGPSVTLIFAIDRDGPDRSVSCGDLEETTERQCERDSHVEIRKKRMTFAHSARGRNEGRKQSHEESSKRE